MQQTLLVLKMYAAKLLVLLNVLGETFLSKDDIQTSCKQAKDTGLCRHFFPHNAPRRPTVMFRKQKASYLILLPHRRSPPLPTQHCSSHLSQPVPLMLHWKHRYNACCCSCCPTGYGESWTPQVLGSVPQVRIPFTSSSKQHNHNAWATQGQGRFTGTGQVLPLYRKHGALSSIQNFVSHSSELGRVLWWRQVTRQSTWTLQQYTLQTNQLWPRLNCTQALTNSWGYFYYPLLL